jgi:nucleoid-associated protein YgaU
MSSDKPKADFSDVQGGAASTARVVPKADFSDVVGGVESTAPIVPEKMQTYTVVKGDTLSAIAKHHYGKASRWHDIFEANRDLLKDPDHIYPGQILKLPDVS